MNATTKVRNVAALVFTGVLAFGLSACGSSDRSSMDMTSTTAAAAGANVEHNAADVTFVQNMIPHHTGALDMAKLAATNASSSEVKTLATQIEGAQQPEIDTMNGWLKAWGQATIDPTTAGHSAMGHDGSTMPGMMSEDSMAKLQAAKGTEFDRQFLQMMTEHHQGAIEMAKTELLGGQSADAKALAQSIIASQQAEVDRMGQLLSQLG